MTSLGSNLESPAPARERCAAQFLAEVPKAMHMATSSARELQVTKSASFSSFSSRSFEPNPAAHGRLENIFH